MSKTNFGEAYRVGISRTINFLVSRGVPRNVAPDIAQSAWMRGWERLAQLRDETMLLSWINTIALNLFRKVLRAHRNEEKLFPAHYERLCTGMNWAAIDVKKILDGCSVPERGLLEAQLEGASAKELAEREGVTQTAMRLRLLRARRSAKQRCQPPVPLPRAA